MIYTVRVGGRNYYIRYKGDIENFQDFLESRQPYEYIKVIGDIIIGDEALVKASKIDSVILENALQKLTNDNEED
ncbi:hypothetical protein [Mammaliicoccus sciuri]|uniref:hypothetical protein n=1 Tax=Mammaliicoccus sciuri TaxID=1296 RepID=UPI00132FA1D6|nr:hypothetical protein [Mammaliicoccus sciuri]